MATNLNSDSDDELAKLFSGTASPPSGTGVLNSESDDELKGLFESVSTQDLGGDAYTALANYPQYDVAEDSGAGNVDRAMQVDAIRKAQGPGMLSKAATGIKDIVLAASDFGPVGVARDLSTFTGSPGGVVDRLNAVKDRRADNPITKAAQDFIGGIGSLAGTAYSAGEEKLRDLSEGNKIYHAALAEGKSPEEIKEIMEGVKPSLGGEMALQQLLAAQNLGAMNAVDIADRAGQTLVDLGSLFTGGVSDEVKRDRFIREQMRELQRRELTKGKTAAPVISDEEIAERLNLQEGEELPDLVDAEAIQNISSITDPTNLAGLGITGNFGRRVAGQVLKQAGRGISATGRAYPAASRVISERIFSKIPTSIKAGAGIAGMVMAPIPAAKAALAAGATRVLSAGLRGLGRIVREAGEEALDPNFITQAGRKAAEELTSSAGKSGFRLREALSPAQNIASAQRIGRKGLVGATQGGLEAGSLAGLYADSPEEFIQEVGVGVLLGKLAGQAGAVKGGDSAQVRNDVANILAEEGASSTYGTGWDDAHAQGMELLTPEERQTVNRFRGWTGRMRSQNGTPIQSYVVNGSDFARAVEADGGLASEAARGEAYTTKDGTKIFVNADATSKAGVDALGHEGIHAIQKALNTQVAPQFFESLQGEISANLYDADGNPNAQFKKFIENRFGDRTDIPMSDMEGEFVAEAAKNIMGGANISDFVLPESIRRKIQRGASKFLTDYLGVEPTKGKTFNGQEISLNFESINDILFDVGRLARETDQATGSQFRIEQIDALLADPLPENATPDQVKERAALERERDQILQGLEDGSVYPEYQPPVSERRSAREAFVDQYATQLRRSSRTEPVLREEALALFEEYANAMDEAGLPLPDPESLYGEVLRYGMDGRVQAAPVSRSSTSAFPVSERSTAPVEPGSVDLSDIQFNEEGWAVDSNNPNRIIRRPPSDQILRSADIDSISAFDQLDAMNQELSSPLDRSATEQQIIDRDALIRRRDRLQEALKSQFPEQFPSEPSPSPEPSPDVTPVRRRALDQQQTIDRYVELGDEVADPLIDPTPEEVAQRNSALSERARLARNLRTIFGIDPSQLDDIPVSSEATAAPESVVPEVAPEVSPEAQSEGSLSDISSPEVESSGGTDLSTVSESIESVPVEALPETRRPVSKTVDQINADIQRITDAVDASYRVGRKSAKTVQAEKSRLVREAMAKEHSASNPDPDAVTWRRDDLTGKESIGGRRFIQGDWFSDQILFNLVQDGRLTPDQVDFIRVIQQNSDKGTATPIVYDSASSTSSSPSAAQRRTDQASSSATDRATGTAPSTLKNGYVQMVGASVSNAGDVNLYVMDSDKYIGNVEKIVAAMGEESPYSGVSDPQFLRDYQSYVDNHRNGYKGSGYGAVTGAKTPVNESYSPVQLDSDPVAAQLKSDFINMAFGDESAKGKSARAEERRAISLQNEGYLSPEGETNALRDRLNKEGKLKWEDVDAEGNVNVSEGSSDVLSRVYSNIRPDLIYQVGRLDDSASTMHSSDASASGNMADVALPESRFISAGFRMADMDPEIIAQDSGFDANAMIKKLEDMGLSRKEIYEYSDIANNQLERKIEDMGGYNWKRDDPREIINDARGEWQLVKSRTAADYWDSVIPERSDLLLTIADASRYTSGDIRDYLIYRGEEHAPEISSMKPYTAVASRISDSIYPTVDVKLKNGSNAKITIRVSDHDQVSNNAPRDYDIDIRATKKKGERQASFEKRYLEYARDQIQQKVDSIWEEQKSIAEPLGDSYLSIFRDHGNLSAGFRPADMSSIKNTPRREGRWYATSPILSFE